MGITGLLPVLKSIQVQKHLSEFAGQTLAVDAYVWLHRGVHACASEMATGKPTHRYVDYAMHRVRLLRHHKITPYIVFDGGPLPAKKGTESERKHRRDENLARGNALAAEGKHHQAREFYVKCVDVTPQMAFQLIKALRAESIAYVVAPYEADAQMAFLERTRIVDGIITEDSDLLVFGSKQVLFKLDAVSSTIISISREDFGSVTASSPDSNGISLVGFSDVQFRTMAILSGCDYLTSIPGIGLKTAWSLLRKWKTAAGVVRAIRLEGKKRVPRDYLAKFTLAEQCFLHQRVYDPRAQRLVYLTDVGTTWSIEANAYVGADIEESLAKQIAMGDVDPATFVPMVDINPDFVPRTPNLPLFPNNSNKGDKGKCPAGPKPSGGGITSFFGPNPVIPTTSRKSPIKATHAMSGMIVGRASGKRTLAEVMDQEGSSTRKKKKSEACTTLPSLTQSHYFGAPNATPNPRNHNGKMELASPGPIVMQEKENLVVRVGDETPSDAQVVQEDGYLSPSPSSHLGSNVSSPVTRDINEDDFGADVLSSPIAASSPSRSKNLTPTRNKRHKGSPAQGTRASASRGTVDLSKLCADDMSSEIDCSDDEHANKVSLGPSSVNGPDSSDADDDGENFTKAIASGWHNQWSLKRSETNVTPAGRHPTLKPYKATTARSSLPKTSSKPLSKVRRKSLNFLPSSAKGTTKAELQRGAGRPRAATSDSVETEAGTVTQSRLSQYRLASFLSGE